jgi:hypothetical protein
MDLANSIVSLQPGMYILRHPKTGMPALSVSRAAANPAHDGTIQAIYTPGTEGSVLRDGRDCIVMQVLNAPVDLLVTAYLAKAGAAVPTLKIDKIALEGERETAPKARAMQVPPKGISIIGHVERKGDVVASAGATLGDPKAESRLEGFQLVWPDKPEGVDVTYSARVEGAGAVAPVSTGQFVGTRNAAKRIVEVSFGLSGAKASQYSLKGKAYFSGGFDADIASGASLSGPSGLEHLTAVALEVVPAPAGKPSKGAWEASPRTKVFRGKVKPAQK